MNHLPKFCLCLVAFLLSALSLPVFADKESDQEWITLFNGKDLGGWTPKITGYPCGKNPLDTFQVDNGILKVSYDAYDKFDGRYGHLYTNIPYSRYLLRMEYRFTGKMMADAPHYVNLNSGVIHRVNGKEVLRYQRPQLDPEGRVESSAALIQAGAPTQLHFGYIALQAEGQPVWFRNIKLKSLED